MLGDLEKADAPLLLVIAGHNGAGKSTFYRKYLHAVIAEHIKEHIDPDAIERDIRANWTGAPQSDLEFSMRARDEANELRKMYLDNEIAFSFETVFSDPVSEKINFLKEAVRRGYFVVLLAVGLDSPGKSIQRVALRVSRKGHTVPPDKINERYPRVLNNIAIGVFVVSIALVVDNSEDTNIDDGDAFFPIALFADGELLEYVEAAPEWWRMLQDQL